MSFLTLMHLQWNQNNWIYLYLVSNTNSIMAISLYIFHILSINLFCSFNILTCLTSVTHRMIPYQNVSWIWYNAILFCRLWMSCILAHAPCQTQQSRNIWLSCTRPLLMSSSASDSKRNLVVERPQDLHWFTTDLPTLKNLNPSTDLLR